MFIPHLDVIHADSFVKTELEKYRNKRKFDAKSYLDITGDEIVNYPMNECFSRQTSVQVGSIFKQHNEWHFKAIGAGYTLELAEIVSGYGGGV